MAKEGFGGSSGGPFQAHETYMKGSGNYHKQSTSQLFFNLDSICRPGEGGSAYAQTYPYGTLARLPFNLSC